MGQEQGSTMTALKSRSMNGTVDSLKMRRTKSIFFIHQHTDIQE